MWSGLAVSYGTFAGFIFKYLTSKKPISTTSLFIGLASELSPGEHISFSSPDGETYLLTDMGEDAEERYMAFSSRCPHLGCKVIWKKEESIYFCPCHHGVFSKDGVATDGPPAKAGQSLKHAKIEVHDNAIYAIIETV